MKINKFIAVSFLILIAKVQGQNLVPNPSFEIFTSCPTNEGQVNLAIPWFNPTGNNPDYCNTCYIGPSPVIVDVPANTFGYQSAKTGDGYMDIGVFPGGREYIEVKLLDSLIAGTNYCVTFYVSPGDSCRWTTSKIGAYFSIDTVQSPYVTVLNYAPQVENSGEAITDVINWTKISGIFTAAGGEKFMTIGNFYNDANTDTVSIGNFSLGYAYFYIDDISVYELPQDSTNCYDIVGIGAAQKENAVAVYPNPAANELIIKNPEHSSGFTIEKLEIFNIFGERVFSQLPTATSQLILDISALPSGVYFINLTDMKTGCLTKKFVKL